VNCDSLQLKEGRAVQNKCGQRFESVTDSWTCEGQREINNGVASKLNEGDSVDCVDWDVTAAGC
jgi:hypothetical protein